MENEGGRQRYGGTILVVDDKPANIKLLFDALQGTGYRTLAALEGESAVRQAELAAPDLILMDVMMPGIDGFEACRRLKELPATRHIPVIFMTALADTTDKIKGFKAGGVDYLTKPLQHDEVLARIDAQIGRHRLWADVQTYSELLLAIGAADSLDKAWAAVATLAEGQPDIAGVALWLAMDRDLALRYVSGFSRGGPGSWRWSGGDYRLVPCTDPLLGPVYGEKLQAAAADESAWSRYPAWARSAGLRGYVITPVCCQEECYGVLAVFFQAPVRFVFEERQRWHHILAHSFGNALFQARSLNAISELSRRLQQENEGLRAEVSAPADSGSMVGSSAVLRRVLDQLDLVAPTDAAVLILGESGTGKELLAQKIHMASSRREAPIIRVNCAAIPRELFESEFFGHVKGAFTGAVKDRVGRFELAAGGTLFLDEVGEIPIELQGKLLRVLQEGSFERIGEEKTRHVDVRIVAATNRDLQQAVADGLFRQDLFYRLSVFPLTLPPLRQRREDIPSLVRHFSAVVARKMGLPPPEISDVMIDEFLDYEWPGNIRELHNEIERAMILSRGRPLSLAAPASGTSRSAPGAATDNHLITEEQWQEMQRENYLRALRQTAWRVDGPGGAAELLGLRPTTLRSRMKVMAITRPV